MLNVLQDKNELTRRGFITTYPLFRYWRKEAVDEGLSDKPLNVYVHLPYCIQRCAYCHYKTTTLKENQKSQIDRYVEALCHEIEIGSKRFHLKERPAITLYFGGGTPTLLSEENIDKIMATLYKNLNFVDPEITFEGEPVTLTPRKAEVLKKHGVNRISLGIQSFSDEIVFKTGRHDTEQQALRAIDAALRTGAVVNLDLISGLSGETDETWAHSVSTALATGAHGLTVYKLEIYANTDYYHGMKTEDLTLPSDDQEMAFVAYAYDEFRKGGYKPVNFFTFTKDGAYRQRHITTKWQGVDTYAFGVSAFGALGNWAYQNTNELELYQSMVEKDELPTFRGFVYTSLDLMVRDVMLGMKLIHFSHREFKRRYGMDLLRICGPEIKELIEGGFVTVSDENISLTDKGILYGDYTGRVLGNALQQFGGPA
ncbi:MAG TPA: coproporphyrinogen-III oxidase family protein [Thermoanaerobaculia bacterium]|nr:coproporphyrinogen-III oxidase family protein [Thermoanaerobaculia bacterium]